MGIANAGVGGDRTQHVLWRLDNGLLAGSHPSLIVLLIGTNNLRSDTEKDILLGELIPFLISFTTMPSSCFDLVCHRCSSSGRELASKVLQCEDHPLFSTAVGT